MLNIPDEIKALFQTDGVRKNFHVRFPNADLPDLNNEDILQESVTFTESLCSHEYFKFGCAEASQIEFTAVGIPNILGEEIECGIEIDCSSLGSDWAEENQPDTSLPWLEPQTWIPGTYTKSEENPSIQISADEKVLINEIHVPITFTQSGSGDPTPSNIREFSTGTTFVQIRLLWVDGSGSSYRQLKNTNLLGIYYEGMLDFCSGKLTITKQYANLGDLTWKKGTIRSGTYNWFYTEDLKNDILPPSSVYSEPTIACNCYTPRKLEGFGVDSSSDLSIVVQTVDGSYEGVIDPVGSVGILDLSKESSTAANFKSYLSSIGAKLVYPLKEPLVIQLTEQTFLPETGAATMTPQVIPDGSIIVDYSVFPTSGPLVYRVPYGRFIVDSCPRDHGAMYNRKIVGYTADQIKNEQIVQGQFPVKSVKVNVLDWMKSKLGELSIPLQKSFYYVSPTYQASLIGASDSARPFLLDISGIRPASDYGGGSPDYTVQQSGYVCSLARKKYYLKVDFEEHEYDKYADKFRAAALNTLPTGDYKYYSGYYGNRPKTFKNEETAVTFVASQFSPCYFVTFLYKNAAGTAGFYRFSKPVFIKPGEVYLIDPSSLSTFSWANGVSVPSGYSLSTDAGAIELHVCVPMEWDNSAKWNWINSSGNTQRTTISGWSNCAPFRTRHVNRPGKVDIYLGAVSELTTNIPLAIVNNTLKITKGKLGSYYTYANAISSIDAINGAMEIIGAFWKVARTGESSLFNISENQSVTPVPRSQWEEFWWDENDIDPIGQVDVQFSDDSSGDSWVEGFTIGDGESVYVMDENVILKNGKTPSSTIQTALDTYFEPNAAVINFTPVDLSMKGLPYLEAGDKIELTADDGETLETYILEQRISGIQHLQAEVTSVNGSTMKVVET